MVIRNYILLAFYNHKCVSFKHIIQGFGQKVPQGSETETGVADITKRENILLGVERSLFCPSGKGVIFKKSNQKTLNPKDV